MEEAYEFLIELNDGQNYPRISEFQNFRISELKIDSC